MFSSAGGLAWVAADGSSEMGRLPLNTNSVPWSISRDGKWLAFHRNTPETGVDLWIAPLQWTAAALHVGQPRPLVRQPGIQAAPSMSPDGRWLVYGSDESGQIDLYVVPFSPAGPARSGKWQISAERVMSPIWCRTCPTIFYLNMLERRVKAVDYAVKGDTFLPGERRTWSQQQLANVGGFPSFDVTPDGRRILAVVESEETPADETHLRLMLNVGDELSRRFVGR